MLGLAVLLYYRHGFDGLVRAAMVVLGLGFVIFIHELGHFLAAKWCDVHVQTFSIGFGPALPGCSFTRGETTYKLAVLPLGGYVNMVGEGPEADEDEDYPRSFKNKTVGQRMLIISAGVVMNILFGALCFIIVYRFYGVNRYPAVIWRVEPGSRAWQAGVRPGWRLVKIGNKKDPWFDDMRVKVALSGADQAVHFVFEDRNGELHDIDIKPLRDENNLVPVIGVSQAYELKLLPPQLRKVRSNPLRYDSAAASARAIDLPAGAELLAATDPGKDGKLTPLAEGAKGWAELCERMRAAGTATMRLQVRPGKGKPALTLELPAVGFAFGDAIVGTTDPATPDEPFHVTPLPLDPTQPPEKKLADPFVFRDRMARLAGKPVVLRVRRWREPAAGGEAAASEPDVLADVLTPPAYHYRLGLRMKMGKVAAVRSGSSAEEKGLVLGSEILGAQPVYGKEKLPPLDFAEMDPVRLPSALARRIHGDPKRPDLRKWGVLLRVRTTQGHDANAERTLELAWDDSWKLAGDAPVMPAAPMAIPQLGVAYWVDSQIEKVTPGSPADKAGLKANDQIRSVRFREAGKPGTPREDAPWGPWTRMASVRGPEKEVFDEWANVFWVLQENDYPVLEVKVKRGSQEISDAFGPIEGQPDPTWPTASRGLRLVLDSRLQKANTLAEAVEFGLDRTMGFIKQIYLNLLSLMSGRISVRSLGGPLEIATQAFSFAGEDLSVFALFLGVISINLAVVNFLPIPILDGGHMVFLIYEKLRGRPPSETVRAVATYVGLVLIVSLMLFVFYQDIRRNGWLTFLGL
jgi:regulator of sigma E protease